MSQLSARMVDRILFDEITLHINAPIHSPQFLSIELEILIEIYQQLQMIYNQYLIFEDIYFEKLISFPLHFSGEEQLIEMNLREYSFLIVQFQLILDYLGSYGREDPHLTTRVHTIILTILENAIIPR